MSIHFKISIAMFALLASAAGPASEALALPLAPRTLPEFPQSVGLGEVIAFVLVALFLVGGVVTYLKLPLLEDRFREEEAFWNTLPVGKGGYLGVLYRDEVIYAYARGGCGWGAAPFFVRRILVLLKHGDAVKDQVLYQNELSSAAGHRHDDYSEISVAIRQWIEAAQHRGVPTVYWVNRRWWPFAKGAGFHILSPDQITEWESDSEGFAKKLSLRINCGKALRQASAHPALVHTELDPPAP